MEALEALRLTAARLQEARIASDLEALVMGRATAALTDPFVDRWVEACQHSDPARVDTLRAPLDDFEARHPVVRMVFVSIRGELRCPRVNAPLPAAAEDWLGEEPKAVRARLREALGRAEALEDLGRARDASNAYRGVERLASSRRIQGLAAAGTARTLARTGARQEAVAAYRRLAEQFGDTYSLAGRPHQLLAAVELVQLGSDHDANVARARRDLLAGRWTITASQAEFFLSRLPHPESPGPSSFLEDLTTAQRLTDQFRATRLVAGRVSFVGLGEGRELLQIAYRTTAPPDHLVGIVADLGWVRSEAGPTVVSATGIASRVRLEPDAPEHASFRTILPGWRVQILPDHPDRPIWARSDLLAFTATVLVVLGVLVMGVLLLIRDVQRETTVNQLRADLVGGVSHELKTPLSIIRMYAETLDEVRDAPAADRQWLANAIVQETGRLSRLIDGIIDFSRTEQGERSYTFARRSLGPIVTRTADRFREYLLLHGFALEASIDTDLPEVDLDATAVDQAVMNLLDNAFKYSGDSRRIRVRVTRQAGAVAVEVEDEGVGIEPAEQARIFERYHRGTHPDRGGYGLGLSLVQHIVNAHRGSIEVASVPGSGSTFRLLFPVANVQPEPLISPSLPADAGRATSTEGS